MNMTIHTKQKDEVVDITDQLEELIERNSLNSGICFIFVQHTTCCVTTADLDPGTDLDLLDALRSVLPKISYRHPHNPAHAPDHILSSLIGCSLSVPFHHKRLLLGTWQRIVLIELDGPRTRNIEVSFVTTEA